MDRADDRRVTSRSFLKIQTFIFWINKRYVIPTRIGFINLDILKQNAKNYKSKNQNLLEKEKQIHN